MVSEYSSNSKAIDFGTIYNNKPAAALLGTHDRIILFDSILNFEELEQLHQWLGKILQNERDLKEAANERT